MRGVIIALNHDGTRNRIELNSPDFMRAVKTIVGGKPEQVSGFNVYAGYKCVVFCNKDSEKRDEPRFNQQATEWWYRSLRKMDLKGQSFLYGNIAIVYGDEEFMNRL